MKTTSGRKAVRKTKKKVVSKAKPRKKNAKRVTKPKKKPAVVSGGPLVLCSHPGIRNIAALRSKLITVRDAECAIIIDTAAVESIDTAALQLLTAFTNAVRERSQSIEWRNTSCAFREMADLADLSKCLGLGEETDAEDDDLCPVF